MSRIRISGLFLALILLCTGCAQEKAVQRQTFAMDTFMSFTAYGKGAEEALDNAVSRIAEMEQALSVTLENSDVSRINHAEGEWVEVPGAIDAISTAKALCERTGGVLDITAYPAVKAWGFTTGEYRVPSADELAELTTRIDYTRIELDETTSSVRLPADMELDLGAVAKGWAGEELAQMLTEAGVESATLSLGGNVQTIGANPDGSPWRVGIQAPGSGQGAYLASVEVVDMAVVTSGGYERYFEQDGEIYWHILDPETAAPARSDVVSATIVGPQGSVCDALSTTLFIMGSEQAAQFWRENQDLAFDYVLILEDGSIHITQGLEDSFHLVDGDTDQKVTVTAP